MGLVTATALIALACTEQGPTPTASPGGHLLATVHWPYNTDVPEVLASILRAFMEIDETVVFLVHPRTR